MTQAGIEQKIFDKYFERLSNDKCESEPFVEIGFDVSQISFFNLIYGTVIAFIVAIIEKAVSFVQGSKRSFETQSSPSHRFVITRVYPQNEENVESCTTTRKDLPKGLRRRSTFGELPMKIKMKAEVQT